MANNVLSVLQKGIIIFLKVVWIILKSFFEAVTYDFFDNVRKYWKKVFKKKPEKEPSNENLP